MSYETEISALTEEEKSNQNVGEQNGSTHLNPFLFESPPY